MKILQLRVVEYNKLHPRLKLKVKKRTRSFLGAFLDPINHEPHVAFSHLDKNDPNDVLCGGFNRSRSKKNKVRYTLKTQKHVWKSYLH